MRVRASFETLFGIGALAAEIAVGFLIHLDLIPRSAGYFLLGLVSIICILAFYLAWQARDRLAQDEPRIVLEGHFSHDPNDAKPQGIFIRNAGGPAHDVRVQPFGMKGSDVTFDEIPLLLATDPPRQLTSRPQGDSGSIWDAASSVEFAKPQPIARIWTSVLGNLKVTRRWPVQNETRRMPLRIKYRDARDRNLTNSEFYLQFIHSSTGVRQETRLVVGRAVTPA